MARFSALFRLFDEHSITEMHELHDAEVLICIKELFAREFALSVLVVTPDIPHRI